MKKEMLKEANDMRRLMGLKLIKEEATEVVNEEDVVGVDAPESAEAEKEDEKDHGDVVNEGEEKLPSMDEMKKCVSEGMSKEAVCEKYSKCDEGEIKEMYEQCKKMNEDSEGEETYNYGEDEGADHKEEEHLEDEEEMAPHDRIKAIEDHLAALKKDMAFDEEHEDRDEEGTHFAESNELSESQVRNLRRRINK